MKLELGPMVILALVNMELGVIGHHECHAYHMSQAFADDSVSGSISAVISTHASSSSSGARHI